ncbi:MAG: hemolysin activation/secretion protein [Halieaceae bacterium]|jgi:hemolysin activation/secretion protein
MSAVWQARGAVVIAFGMAISSFAHGQGDDASRGLRIESLIKPHFEEPRYKQEQTDLLTTPQVLPAPPSEQGNSISTAASIPVQKVQVIGSTIFSAQQLAQWVQPFENRSVSIDELQALRHQLSMEYLNRGYVNSGVVIPAQDVGDGIIIFNVIEGGLTELKLSGNEDIADSYLLYRVNKGVDAPLNVNEIQAALRELQQNSLVRRVAAQLRPLSQLGQSELEIVVTEAPSRELFIGVNNHRTPSVGAEDVSLAYTDYNLSGHGDALSASIASTEGLSELSLAYTLPVPSTDYLVSAYYSQSDSEVVEEPFDQLDIESESSSYGLRVSRPFEFQGRALTLQVGFNHRESDAFLLGEPFSFSAGAIDGESKSTTLELGVDFINRHADRVYAANISVRQGLDALSSNVSSNDDTPDSEFTAFYGQAQFASKLEFIEGSQLIARGAFQLSLDPLLPMEKISVGGHATVRGYRENQLVRDNGVTASVELRVPLPFFDGRLGSLQGVAFIDLGQAWDEDVPSQEDGVVEIGSVGLGVLWRPLDNMNVELYWGEALDEEVIENQSGDLQDDGVHFSVTYAVRF